MSVRKDEYFNQRPRQRKQTGFAVHCLVLEREKSRFAINKFVFKVQNEYNTKRGQTSHKWNYRNDKEPNGLPVRLARIQVGDTGNGKERATKDKNVPNLLHHSPSFQRFCAVLWPTPLVSSSLLNALYFNASLLYLFVRLSTGENNRCGEQSVASTTWRHGNALQFACVSWLSNARAFPFSVNEASPTNRTH